MPSLLCDLQWIMQLMNPDLLLQKIFCLKGDSSKHTNKRLTKYQKPKLEKKCIYLNLNQWPMLRIENLEFLPIG
ncbi:hypothetical protein QTP88_012839 [Uroleucon formosanum]